LNSYFENPDGINEEIEQLEDGVYVEKLFRRATLLETADDGDFVYGDVSRGKKGWFFEPDPQRSLLAIGMLLIRQLAGRETEERDIACFDEECGVSLDGFIETMNARGFTIEEHYSLSMRDVMELLESDGRLLCAVSSGVLEQHRCVGLRGMAADCMIEMTGLDISNPMDIKVFYNHVAQKDGCGRICAWDVFQNSWRVSDKYALFVTKG